MNAKFNKCPWKSVLEKIVSEMWNQTGTGTGHGLICENDNDNNL